MSTAARDPAATCSRPRASRVCRRPGLRVAALALILAGFLASGVNAQVVTGSDGSDGALAPTTNDVDPNGVFWIDLALAKPLGTPGGGGGAGMYDPTRRAVVFQYTAVAIPTGVRVKFRNHPTRCAVAWLVQGDVLIDGELDLDGEDGHAPGAPPIWAEPGPGGFRGARGGQGVSGSPGFGLGGGPRWTFVPGAVNQATWTGPPAGHLEMPWSTAGLAYGNPSLLPLVGGSGGGGLKGTTDFGGGGGGGGAILVAAGNQIVVAGSVHADGGDCPGFGGGGSGSGGSLRLVADAVELADTAVVRCLGGAPCQVAVSLSLAGSPGRVRIEGNQLTLGALSSPHPSLDLPGDLFPASTAPSVRVVEVDGIPAPVNPEGSFLAPFADVRVGDPGLKTVILEGMNIDPGAVVQVRVASTWSEAAWVDSSPLVATGVPGVTAASVTVVLEEGVSTLQLRVVLP